MTNIKLEDLDNWLPDPAWDYAQIWDYLRQIQIKLSALRAELANLEDASAESDRIVQQGLQEIQILCFRAIANVASDPPSQNN